MDWGRSFICIHQMTFEGRAAIRPANEQHTTITKITKGRGWMNSWNSSASFETGRCRPSLLLTGGQLRPLQMPLAPQEPREMSGDNKGEETVGSSNSLAYEYAPGKLQRIEKRISTAGHNPKVWGLTWLETRGVACVGYRCVEWER